MLIYQKIEDFFLDNYRSIISNSFKGQYSLPPLGIGLRIIKGSRFSYNSRSAIV